jgi:ubiquinone/menaquinone biosynthesis C-methylase UbiE
MRGISNIETRWANLEKTSTLDDESCDFVLIANILFQIEKKHWPKIINEIKRILKSDGQVLFVDWQVDSPLGPPKGQRVAQDKFIEIVGKNLQFFRDFNLGDTHWGIVFKK